MPPRFVFDHCSCGHDISEHVHSQGRCRMRDSYGQPCECPSFEHDTNNDDATDDDWNQFEPDGKGR